MSSLRPLLLPVILAVLAIGIYNTRVRREMVDFGVVRQAGARALHAEPLYRVEDEHYQYKYLPAFALAMIPFAVLDQETAKMIWFAISFGLLAAFLRWSIAALPERRWSERTLLWIAVVLMAKFYAHELLLGQANLLLGTLLVAGLLAVQIDRPKIAAGIIAAAVFVKPYALLLLPWLFITQGLEAAAVAIIVIGTGLLLPAALYGWAGNRELLIGWYHTVTASTAPNLLGNDNVSLVSMWAKWIGPGKPAFGLAAISSVGVLGLVAVAWRKRDDLTTPEYLECALLMLLVPLLSPQGWDYVLLLGTPAVVCLVDRWREIGRPAQWILGTALVFMCLTMFDVMGRTMYGHFMQLAGVSVSALVVAGGLVYLRWRKLA
jgi:hypothetical protein